MTSPLGKHHHNLDAALAAAGRCYNRVLISLPSVDRTAGWNPETATWQES
ncbi:hypothetical protein [Nocardia fluminea]